MIYKNLKECVNDLESKKQLIRIPEIVNPDLEIAEIHRRVYDRKGPALLFENVRGSKFQALTNLFGTIDRTEYIFQDVLRNFDFLCKLKMDPIYALKHPIQTMRHIPAMLSAIPRKSTNKNLLLHKCEISDIPQIKSWQDDGGAFVTLPQVISFPPGSNEVNKANIGMYRIQLSGNNYIQNKEIGLHYQLHRGIGIHHKMYLEEHAAEFKISIAVGGPPCNTLASIFPLPEGMSEIFFSGILGNKAYKYFWYDGYFFPSEADFVITGRIKKNQLKPEGPFGDHLGYYSLTHEFPVLEVDQVYHRKDAIWHFTVVGRPPQEDSSFGHIIHQLVRNLTTHELPGIREVHAVDAAGVHPLLLAIGSERYMPFRDRKPEEILTQANLLLGKGQTSLAKFLIIIAEEPSIKFSAKNIPEFFAYFLARIDFEKDLHFLTNTTIDTLDYSGNDWNSGSKIIMSVNRDPLRKLTKDLALTSILESLNINSKFFIEGILLIQFPKWISYNSAEDEMQLLNDKLKSINLNGLAMIVICDDIEFTSCSWNNFLWITFTRTNPSHDIYGINSYTMHKHWACKGPLVFDARIKTHHAPPLLVSEETNKSVDKFIASSPSLQSILQ